MINTEQELIGKQTVIFKNKPSIIGFYSLVGEKEGNGNFAEYFDHILKDDLFGEKSYEKAERKILETSIFNAIEKAGLQPENIDCLLSGDLLNQIISSSFSARHFGTCFIGLYGACSTMAESLALGSALVDGGYFNTVACATASHFSSVEKQFRFPLELGNQRTPCSQWTVTGGACTILSKEGKGPYITAATFGRVTDWGITDVNNMGAAMAPSAMSTLIAHFKDCNTTSKDYDLIVTGDLGKLGSEILIDLMEKAGYPLGQNYNDCGQMIFNKKQRVFQGGSGAGCSATVLNSYILKNIIKGKYKKVLFCATGALLSTLSSQQGESVPGICHAVVIERDKDSKNSVRKSNKTNKSSKSTKAKTSGKKNIK